MSQPSGSDRVSPRPAQDPAKHVTGAGTTADLLRQAAEAFRETPMPLDACLSLRALLSQHPCDSDPLFTFMNGRDVPLQNQELATLLQGIPLGGWRLSGATINVLVDEIARHQPTAVLEFGSGVSTVVLAAAMRAVHGLVSRPLVFSIDQSPEFLADTERLLKTHGLRDLVRLHCAPLTQHNIQGFATVCYGLSEATLASFFEGQRPDFILIDGPAADYGQRFGTLPLVEPYVSPDARVYMDDALRDSELAIADYWNRLGQLTIDGIRWVGKGLFIGTMTTRGAEASRCGRELLAGLLQHTSSVSYQGGPFLDPPVSRRSDKVPQYCQQPAPTPNLRPDDGLSPARESRSGPTATLSVQKSFQPDAQTSTNSQGLVSLRHTQPLEKADKVRLKIMQIDTFYPAPLEKLYARVPGLGARSFEEQIDAIFGDGFAAIHTLAPYLGSLGHEVKWVVGNCAAAQLAWAKQHGVRITSERTWVHDIVRAQIEAFNPDVLYTTDSMVFDSRFMKSLAVRPKLVIGWQASDIPAETDWSDFDLILSPLQDLRKAALSVGAKAAEHFLPGFPQWAYDQVRGIAPAHDVVFCGQWTQGQHAKRNEYWAQIARDSQVAPRYSCAFYLSGQQQMAPEDVRRLSRPATYGLEMFRAIRQGRIGLDARATHRHYKNGSVQDIGGRETANMRIFEVTGCGAFLLTEHYDNLADYFEIGKEIETFRDARELLEKVRYYLAHEEERTAIAVRGHERCLREHSMDRRIRDFDALIQRHLPKGQETPIGGALQIQSDDWVTVQAEGDFSALKQQALRTRFGRWRVRYGSLTIHCHDLLSFYMSAKDIFLHRIYDFTSDTDAPVVIDGGGFIGLFTLFVKAKYPKAKMRVFEPDGEALQLLKMNLKANHIQDVEIIPAGLYKQDGEIGFASDHSDGSTIFTAKKTSTIRVCRLSPYLTEPVDFLKLNIEGAEYEVMAEIGEKLSQIAHIAIEYHGFPELQQTLHPILAQFDRQGYRYFIHDFDEETNPTTKPPRQIDGEARFWLLVTAKRMPTVRPWAPLEATAGDLVARPTVSTCADPISRSFGFDRGLPIDRYYIEAFLRQHCSAIRGRVLEIGDNTYTRKFGSAVESSDVLSVEPGAGVSIVADLASGRDLPKEAFDCIIMPQTIQMVFDVHAALRHVVEALKPGGVLLVTASGISQISRYDMDRWGEFWRFTDKSLRTLLELAAPGGEVEVEAFGNVASAKAFLDGHAAQELPRDILERRDPDYQVLLAACVRKARARHRTDLPAGSDAQNGHCQATPKILLYHRVWSDPVDAHSLAVSAEHFESHLKYLTRHYHVLPLRQMVEAATAGTVQAGTIALTFDDGYADLLYNAVPLLEQYRVHATVFVTSGMVGSTKEFWWDTLEQIFFGLETLPEALTLQGQSGARTYDMNCAAARIEAHDVLWSTLQRQSSGAIALAVARLAEWAGLSPAARPTHRIATIAELRQLAASTVIEIGAHTVTHPALSRLSLDAQRQEIGNSKRELESYLQRPVQLFSYPFGSVNDFTGDTATLVREAGFIGGIANVPGDLSGPQDSFALPRRVVRDWTVGDFSRWLTETDKSDYERQAQAKRDARLQRRVNDSQGMVAHAQGVQQ